MSSYNYLRNRSHSSGQQPQGQPPLLPPTSTRSSSSSDYFSSLPHSVPIQHQPIPPCSTGNWGFTETPTRQISF
ncbi:2203_t:CDS:2 [Rhizophagus irregularis]|nr:2203_t:CDS:2 [Rhizophagus irregularis]